MQLSITTPATREIEREREREKDKRERRRGGHIHT